MKCYGRMTLLSQSGLSKSCVKCWKCCLSCRALHSSISSRYSEVHLVPNKSQSTAFVLYTSRHLACNLPVCRGDLWPPNDPDRRHACNCSGMAQRLQWQSLSIFLYTYFVKWEGLWRITVLSTGHCRLGASGRVGHFWWLLISKATSAAKKGFHEF